MKIIFYEKKYFMQKKALQNIYKTIINVAMKVSAMKVSVAAKRPIKMMYTKELKFERPKISRAKHTFKTKLPSWYLFSIIWYLFVYQMAHLKLSYRDLRT